MRLDLLGPFPFLLLLLGAWGPVLPSDASTQITRFENFQIQHVRERSVSCNIAMRNVNSLTLRCKPQNTFLHDSIQNVADTCLLPNIRCRNGQNNCHRSRRTIRMTYCQLIRGRYPNCRYRTAKQNKLYTVACNPPQPGDPRNYRLVPVHLD